MSDSPGKKKASAGAKKGGKKAGSKPGTAAGKGADGSLKAAAEEERKRLQAELGVVAAGRAAQEAAAKGLEAQLAALQHTHARETTTAADVLASQQRQQEAAKEEARALERQLSAAREEAEALRSALLAAQEAQALPEETEEEQRQQASSELDRLLSSARRQEERLAAQDSALAALRLRLQRTEAALAAERQEVQALQVRALGRSELRFIRGCPFLMRVGRERLRGAAPPAVADALRPGGVLGAAGRQLVLAQPAGMGVLDLHSMAWWGDGGAAGSAGKSADGASCGQAGKQAATAGPQQPGQTAAFAGRAVCSVGSKLLGFGGEAGGQLLPSGKNTHFLHPDLQEWLPAPAPADAAAPLPPPRAEAALAFCSTSHTAYLFGGRGEGGACLGDLWRLDLTSMEWSRLDRLGASRPATERTATRPRSPCSHEAPPPAAGAALAVSPDGSRVWLLGGRLDSGRCSSALHWWDVPLGHWVAVEPPTWTLDTREQHVMSSTGRYLLVAGGMGRNAGGQALYRRDCAIYDTATNSWDVLTDTAFEPAAGGDNSEPSVVVSVAAADPDCSCCSRRTTSGSGGSGGVSASSSRSSSKPGTASGRGGDAPFLGAGTCTFADGKLLVLKPGQGGGQACELWTVELQLPASIEQEQQRAERRTTVFKGLSLQVDAVEATSVRLSWRAPTAGADKLLSFKLMLTNAEGRAREAFEGLETSCHVTGLARHSQYIFCVKALFDDATFVWSEPVMVVTTTAGGASTGRAAEGGGRGRGSEKRPAAERAGGAACGRAAAQVAEGQ